MEHEFQTVDSSSDRCPRFNVSWRAFAVCFLVFITAACQHTTSSVSLALLGDLMLGRGVDPTPDSLAYLMPDLSNVDLTLANLESPLATLLPATIRCITCVPRPTGRSYSQIGGWTCFPLPTTTASIAVRAALL